MQKFFGSLGSHVTIKGNFNCDYGKNIYIGNGTIINCNVTILDTNRVEIGENAFLSRRAWSSARQRIRWMHSGG